MKRNIAPTTRLILSLTALLAGMAVPVAAQRCRDRGLLSMRNVSDILSATSTPILSPLMQRSANCKAVNCGPVPQIPLCRL